MENNDIKNVWKTGVEKDIKPYSEKKLSEMVVKSARKSIKAVYPGTIFRLIIIAVIVYLITTLLWREQSAGKAYIDMIALAITTVSYFFWERSAYQMRKYANDKPVKEWLEYRIKELEKAATFNSKYNRIGFGCSLLCAIGIYVAYQIVSKTTPSILTVIVIPFGIVIYLWVVGRSLNRNYHKSLQELKDLYKQFTE